MNSFNLGISTVALLPIYACWLLALVGIPLTILAISVTSLTYQIYEKIKLYEKRNVPEAKSLVDGFSQQRDRILGNLEVQIKQMKLNSGQGLARACSCVRETSAGAEAIMHFTLGSQEWSYVAKAGSTIEALNKIYHKKLEGKEIGAPKCGSHSCPIAHLCPNRVAQTSYREIIAVA